MTNTYILKLRIHGQYFSGDGNAMVVKSLYCRREKDLLVYHALRRQRKAARNRCRNFKSFDFRQRRIDMLYHDAFRAKYIIN
jgi:hypothetical protein